MEILKAFSEALVDEEVNVYLYGDIIANEGCNWSTDDVYPSKVAEIVNSYKGKTLNLHINSCGGDVFAGLAIYNMLKSRSGKTIVIIDGIAASAASVIAMAGDEIHIPQNAYLMIHRAWCYSQGNCDELRKVAEDLEKLDATILEIYGTKLKHIEDKEKLKNLVEAESYLTGSECEELFDVIVEEKLEAVACISEAKIIKMNLPKELKITKAEKTKTEDVKLALELLKAEMENM